MSTLRRLTVSGVFMLLLALAGCGNNEGAGAEPTNAGQTNPPVAETTQAEPQPEQTSAAPAVELSHVSTLQLRKGNLRAEVKILQGDLQRAEPGLTNGSVSVGSTCGGELDPQFDAVVPYTVELTNKTADFPVEFILAWMVSRQGVEGQGSGAGRVSVGEAYMFGTSQMCEIEGQRTVTMSSMQSGGRLESGSAVSTQGFLILRKYYNPQYPKGDVQAVRHVVIGISSLVADGSTEMKSGGSNPTGGMRKLHGGFGLDYGVSFVPSETRKNCLTNERVECP